jgi:hypothetical protein
MYSMPFVQVCETEDRALSAETLDLNTLYISVISRARRVKLPVRSQILTLQPSNHSALKASIAVNKFTEVTICNLSNYIKRVPGTCWRCSNFASS